MPRLTPSERRERLAQNLERYLISAQNLGLNLDGKFYCLCLFIFAAHSCNGCDHSHHEDSQHEQELQLEEGSQHVEDSQHEHSNSDQHHLHDEEMQQAEMPIDEDINSEEPMSDQSEHNEEGSQDQDSVASDEELSTGEDIEDIEEDVPELDATEEEQQLIHEVLNFLSDQTIPVSERVSDLILLTFMRRHGSNMVFNYFLATTDDATGGNEAYSRNNQRSPP
jgi:hypothetical protein